MLEEWRASVAIRLREVLMATRLSPAKNRSSLNTQRAIARLREVLDRLRVLQSSVTVAVVALRGQNADVDEDVARLLQRSVSDPLQDQIDTIKSVLRLLGPPVHRKRLLPPILRL